MIIFAKLLSFIPMSSFSSRTARIIIAAGSAISVASAEVMLTEDFEKINGPTGAIPFFYKHTTTDASISVTTERARAGKQSLKFDFNFTDWKKEEPKRVEIYDVTTWGPDGMSQRMDWWVGFSQYLPVDWQVDEPANPDIIWQFHGFEGGPASGNPPLSAVVFGDKLHIRLAQGTVPAERAASFLDLAILPLPLGVWTDTVISLSWDYKAGHVRMWQNGKQIVNFTGPTLYPMIGQVNEKGPAFKIGCYKFDWGNVPTKVSHRVLFIDETRFGDSHSSLTEVAPR